MCAVQQNLFVAQGKTFAASFGWAQGSFVWKPISSVSTTAPVMITAVGHDLKDDWPYWVTCVKKPEEINTGTDDELGDPYLAEVLTPDTLSINSINGMCLDAYTAGGVVRYYARADITGYEAEMQVRASAGNATVLYEALSTGVSPAITVDPVTSTFNLVIPAAAFEAATFRDAVYEIEITAPSGEKYRLAFGTFTLSREIVKP